MKFKLTNGFIEFEIPYKVKAFVKDTNAFFVCFDFDNGRLAVEYFSEYKAVSVNQWVDGEGEEWERVITSVNFNDPVRDRNVKVYIVEEGEQIIKIRDEL